MKERSYQLIAKSLAFVIALSLTGLLPSQVKLYSEVELHLRSPDNEPVANKRFRVVLESSEGHYFELLESDDRGNLAIPIPEEYAERADGVIKVLQAKFTSHDNLPDAYVAAVNVPFRQLHKTRRKRVQMKRPKLLLGGVVVDRQGKPLAGVQVKLGANHTYRWTNRRNAMNREVYELSVATDDAGKFAIHDLDPTRSQINPTVVLSGMARAESAKFTVGQANAKIVMDQTTSVRCKIAGVPEGKYYPYAVRLVGNGLNLSGSAYARRNAGGWVDFSQCVPGTYDLKVFGDHYGRKAIATIRGIKIKAGKQEPDPRLMDIDVSKHLIWYHLTVKFKDGESPGQIKIRRANSTTTTSSLKGWYSASTKGTASKISVSANGYRPKTIQPKAQEKLVVELEKGWTLTVSVPNLPNLVATELRVEDPNEHGYYSSYNARTPLSDAKETLNIFMEQPGTKTVELHLTSTSPKQRGAGRSSDPDNRIILGKWKIEIQAAKHPPGKPIEWKPELTATQRALAASFDKLMQERDQ